MLRIVHYFGNLIFSRAFDSKLRELEDSFTHLKNVTELLLEVSEVEDDPECRLPLQAKLREFMSMYDIELAGLYTLQTAAKKNLLDMRIKLRVVLQSEDQLSRNRIYANNIEELVQHYQKFPGALSVTRRSLSSHWVN